MVTSTRKPTKAEELIFEEEASNGPIFQDLANSELATFVPYLIKDTLLKTKSLTIALACVKHYMNMKVECETGYTADTLV